MAKVKQKKKKRGLKVFMTLTLLQWGALLGVNLYLAPDPIVPAAAQNILSSNEDPPVKAPADADQFRLSDDKKLVAYTKDKELFLANKDSILYQKKVGRVTYLQWLGKSNSLLYFVQDSSLTGYIIQASTLKPHELESWKGTDRKIRQAYFNPYMEFLYLETERDNVDEIYKYDAVNGIYKFPLPNIKIDRINFDEKTDTMEIYDSMGRLWNYKNGHLYDPKGNLMDLKRIKEPSPNEGLKKEDLKQDKPAETNPTQEVPKETTTKETTKQPTTKTTDQMETGTKSPATTTTTPTQTQTTTKKDTTGGIEPPVINQQSTQGSTTTTTKQSTTKETIPPKQ